MNLNQLSPTPSILLKRFLILTVLGLLLAFIIIFALAKRARPAQQTISLGDDVLNVWVAATGPELTRGLSNVAYLPNNSGLLFVFSTLGDHRIWMKDMNFAIDIIWLNENLKVVDITQNVTPDSYPKQWGAKVPVKYVIEVPAGWAHEHGVKIGESMVYF